MKVKNNVIKLLASVIAIGITLLAIFLLKPKPHKIPENSSIRLIIESENRLYDNQIVIEANDSLLIILEKNFQIKKMGLGNSAMLLGIIGDDFEIVSDFETNFLHIYEIKENKEISLNYGASDIYLKDEQIILIRLEPIWKND